MAFRFTIGKKIGTGFGVLIFFVVVVFYTTYNTLNESISKNEKITKVNNPSLSSLEELKLLTVRSKMLIFNWVYYQSGEDDPDKVKLGRLVNQNYPHLQNKIKTLATKWNEEDQGKIDSVFINMAQLFEFHEEVKVLLPDFHSYEDSQMKFLANFMIGDGGDIYEKTNEVMSQLDALIKNQQFQSEQITEEMLNSFSNLQQLFQILGVALILGGILIAGYTTRSIVTPVHQLRDILLKISKGLSPEKKIKERKDEIGEMANALNRVVVGMARTKNFADAIGSGKFDTNYDPLSDEDTLGHALLKMRDDLAETERILEEKVKQRTAEVVQKKEEIELQNEKISELYEEVTDSIKYAKRLQEAILPPDDFVTRLMPNSFVLYKPKDIVSGDFYWVEEKNDKVYFSAVDCTGHGVPGAFMSIVGYNALNEALVHNDNCAAILDNLNRGISQTLNRGENETAIKDGMDLALCSYDPKKRKLEFAGAYNPLYLLRDGEITQIKADKFPIGSYYEEKSNKYKNNSLQLKKGDYIYIFSDGYADQFGGPRNKKFMYKQFREAILAVSDKEMDQQKEILTQKIEAWRGSEEQVDDILVMGLQIV